MRLRPPRQLNSYTVFVSSAEDALALRKRVRELVQQAFVPQLMEARKPFTLMLDMWEGAAAQRPQQGETVNDMFVARAKDSDLTLVLLLDTLGEGTKEEVEAVLETDDVQVSVLHFSTRTTRQNAASKVGRFIKDNRHKFLYERRFCDASSDETWYAIVKTLLAVLIQGVAPDDTKEPLVELR